MTIEKDMLYLIELFADSTERVLLAALYDKPKDKATRDAYVDYLIERGRNLAADMIRKGWTPGRRTKQSKPRQTFGQSVIQRLTPFVTLAGGIHTLPYGGDITPDPESR